MLKTFQSSSRIHHYCFHMQCSMRPLYTYLASEVERLKLTKFFIENCMKGNITDIYIGTWLLASDDKDLSIEAIMRAHNIQLETSCELSYCYTCLETFPAIQTKIDARLVKDIAMQSFLQIEMPVVGTCFA